jgi:hypothetical protein
LKRREKKQIEKQAKSTGTTLEIPLDCMALSRAEYYR